MNIAFYDLKNMSVDTRIRLMRRAQANIDSVINTVEPIIKDVRDNGDDALIHYAKKFEGANLKSIKATKEEFEQAEKNLDEDLKSAIKHCVTNVKKFHAEQMRRVDVEWMIEIEPGVFAGEKVTPIDSVGLYVPRGKGAFPSAMYMLCIPAVIAGVKDIAVVTPPTPNGAADDASLYTAKICGVKNIYKVGGAQAIAALAYGTKTIPKVRKVLGPGSPYVAAAKRTLSDIIDPGMPAGPSDAIILIDETANPYNAALDLLNEAEHGKDSATLLVTHDKNVAQKVQHFLPQIIAELPEPHRSICTKVLGTDADSYGGIIVTGSLEQSIAFINEYAPEHLHMVVRNPENIMPHLKNAGEILIGEYTPSTLGNYGTGVNHVLPTGGWAHTYSCTSVWDFLKRTSISRCTKDGMQSLSKSVLTLTDYEGFPAHGDVIRKRKL